MFDVFDRFYGERGVKIEKRSFYLRPNSKTQFIRVWKQAEVILKVCLGKEHVLGQRVPFVYGEIWSMSNKMK